MGVNSTARLVNSAIVHRIESVVAIDKPHDMAIIKVKNISAPVLTLGNSDSVQIGDSVYLASNPDDYVGTFSDGIVSAIRPGGRFVADKVFQVTAPASPGSSGGPVFNSRGEVIAMLNSGDTDGQNLNFATPVKFLKTLIMTIK